MKKFFEKHSLGKLLAIFFILAFVLTWIVPTGSFNGAEYVAGEKVRLGLADLGNLLYFMIYMSIDKVLFLLVLGVFYGILQKIPAYNNLVLKIANKIKGKEILFAVISSVLIAVLTSFSFTSFGVLVFVPFIISIILNAKMDKMTAFMVTFGSILVGTLGATFGTDGFYWLNSYITQQSTLNFMKIDVWYRVLVLVVSLILFNFFTIIHIKNVLKKNVNESKNDVFEVESKKSKESYIPLIVLMSIILIITVLGIIDWNGNFGITTFNSFHEWLTSLSIGKNDFKLIASILGSSLAPFGNQLSDYAKFNLYSLDALLLVFSLLLIIIYRIDFTKFKDAALNGLKKMGKVSLLVVAAYSVYIIFYFSPMMSTITHNLIKTDGRPDINIDYKGSGIAFFNLDKDNDQKADFNLVNDATKNKSCTINCDTDGDGWPDAYLDFDGDGKITEADETIEKTYSKSSNTSTLNYDSDQDGYPNVNVDTDFSIAKTTLAAFITHIFHNDMVYTGYTTSGYMLQAFGANINLIVFIFVAMFGFVAFIAPTSIILVAGLTYTDVDYKDYIKYIWKFALGMLLCLLLIFILMRYL